MLAIVSEPRAVATGQGIDVKNDEFTGAQQHQTRMFGRSLPLSVLMFSTICTKHFFMSSSSVVSRDHHARPQRSGSLVEFADSDQVTLLVT